MKRAMFVAITFLSATASASDAARIDARVCVMSEALTIDRADDLRIGTSEVRGMADSLSSGGRWDQTTIYCRSLWTSSKTIYEFSNRCTHVDRDGDRFFTMSTGTSIKAYRWTYVAGTGKYAGISGGGDAVLERSYPKATPTLGGVCFKVTGQEQRKVELSK